MNGVPVARHRLILGEDEATASKKLFKHLLGPPGLAFVPQRAPNIKHQIKLKTFVKNPL